MGQINARTITIRKKNPSKPQKKIQMRKAVINNQMMRFNQDAAKKRGR
jgi:hypothetical protein